MHDFIYQEGLFCVTSCWVCLLGRGIICWMLQEHLKLQNFLITCSFKFSRAGNNILHGMCPHQGRPLWSLTKEYTTSWALCYHWQTQGTINSPKWRHKNVAPLISPLNAPPPHPTSEPFWPFCLSLGLCHTASPLPQCIAGWSSWHLS